MVEALRAGESINSVAKRFNRGVATVTRAARSANVASEYSAPKRAIEARRDYDLAARLELLNEGFKKAANLLASIADPADLQRWTVAVGVLIDKRRLEDGDVTSRTETVGDSEFDGLARQLDELAARRRARELASEPQPGTAATA